MSVKVHHTGVKRSRSEFFYVNIVKGSGLLRNVIQMKCNGAINVMSQTTPRKWYVHKNSFTEVRYIVNCSTVHWLYVCMYSTILFWRSYSFDSILKRISRVYTTYVVHHFLRWWNMLCNAKRSLYKCTYTLCVRTNFVLFTNFLLENLCFSVHPQDGHGIGKERIIWQSTWPFNYNCIFCLFSVCAVCVHCIYST